MSSRDLNLAGTEIPTPGVALRTTSVVTAISALCTLLSALCSVYKRPQPLLSPMRSAHALSTMNFYYRREYTVTKRTLALILVMMLLSSALLLQGCLQELPAETETPETNSPPVSEEPPDESVSAPVRRGLFTLRYDPESTVNPITGMSSSNILLASLLYESLFSLDANLDAEPVLCDAWSVEDNLTYTFSIKPDVAASDGSTLTASDVVYTLTQASQHGRFVNRLKNIDKITSEDELSVTIKLKSPNRRFIRLLDIPIIKSGSINDRIPPGTGPYVFANPDALRLERFSGHRDYQDLPVTAILLKACGDEEAAELFEDGQLSLLWDDPADTYEIRLNRVHEKRYYDTTALQYIGFNTRSVVLKEPDVRRAIGDAVDREYIVGEILQGQALAAGLALSPSYNLYDARWQRDDVDQQREMSALLARAGLEDYDDDSYLEYPDGDGGFISFSLDFIVNIENQYKVRAAYMIAETLMRTGILVNVRELSWDNFIGALQSGSFDMYYGEVVLSADFDLSALLLPGSSLNFGKTGSSEYAQLIADFLGASSAADEQAAAKELCDTILRSAPFVPVLYKKYAVYTPMGAISGAAPSQSGVFHTIKDWTIDLTMLS